MTENQQNTRSFQCRESLWACFDQMARELECSVDYLLNDAMKQYARQRGYTSNGADSMAPVAGTSVRPATLGRAPLPPPVSSPPVSFSQAQTLPAPAASPASGPPPFQPPGSVVSEPAEANENASAAESAEAAPPPYPPVPAGAPAPTDPAAVPAPAAAPGASASGRPPVHLYYMGERFPVTKDRFIIGRGRQSSDLTIKDPNVSRQHAMIEYLNGYYYMVDMGSTNGVEYAGQRIQRRVVNEGDTFRVCDHELRFSFQ